MTQKLIAPSYEKYPDAPKPSLTQKISLAINGYAFYKYMKRSTDLAYMPVYIVRCHKHGNFLDHLQGYDGHFTCEKCLLER